MLKSVALLLCLCWAPDDEPKATQGAREQLEKFQDLVGAWRGVGQLQRGSTKGAWTEKCEWKWRFGPDSVPSLEFVIADARQLKSGRLTFQQDTGSFRIEGELAAGQAIQFDGSLDGDRLVLLATKSQGERPARITIRRVAGGDRLIMLYESSAGPERYQRIAEVGFTRDGSGFGKGTNFVECVVTGGRGTIPVVHRGTTYYVCCTGCRDHFNDNAERVLADYRARKDAEKNK